jgi:hypothetical protein
MTFCGCRCPKSVLAHVQRVSLIAVTTMLLCMLGQCKCTDVFSLESPGIWSLRQMHFIGWMQHASVM